MKTHYPQLDLMRGIAIILVVMGHVLILGVEYGHTLIVNILASMHVPAFILVSGFLSAQSSTPNTLFYWKKVIQLLLPLVFIPPLYILVSHKGWDTLFFNEYHAGYWFTYVLFLLFIPYGLFRVLASWISNKTNKLTYSLIFEALLAILSLSIILVAEHLLQDSKQLSGLCSLPLLSWLYPYLLLGHFIARYEALHRLYTNKYIVLLALVTAVGTIALDFNGFPILRGIPRTMSSVCVLYNFCIYLSSLPLNRGIRVLKQISSDSLGIYLWHYFFLFSFPMTEWVKYLSNGNGTFVWELILTISASAVVISLTYFVITLLKTNTITRRLFLGSK